MESQRPVESSNSPSTGLPEELEMEAGAVFDVQASRYCLNIH